MGAKPVPCYNWIHAIYEVVIMKLQCYNNKFYTLWHQVSNLFEVKSQIGETPKPTSQKDLTSRS